jgi:hypothetical protein
MSFGDVSIDSDRNAQNHPVNLGASDGMASGMMSRIRKSSAVSHPMPVKGFIRQLINRGLKASAAFRPIDVGAH